MINISVSEFMILCSSVLLIFLLLTEVLDWTQLFPWAEECNFPRYTFGYADRNGPHMWKLLYPDSNGGNQSPINVTTQLAVVVQPSEPLRWSGYDKGPLSMTITNNENNVVLNTMWSNTTRPYIQGGCLTSVYDLCSMVFHWGHSNEEGSEHTFDYVRFPMELQVWHIKRGFNSLLDAITAKENDGILIVSFFFQITNADNPYLDHIVTNLWRIIQPGTKVHIPPFPLLWIFPTFERDYYTYNGSFTQPPCSEIVTWILQPEPIAISSSQVAQFRKICSPDGPILFNCRPVQQVNERSVYFYA
ncbi:carbonic anhydrase 3 [Apis mellifera caucasica]|uniref:Carbonic anhydrase 3 n=1 Tax=Apis mellifera TaxID=7460 RepID=A0A7M7FZF4_APIME|nr:carbonic anhydrase 3 [Apis mellifera]KAG6800793.1 carbonic anhydrase 3 [Apis mellifera caucasica]KAG9428459.1 carbonic anhydrase 3 [Apis mellifera carnica]|eukprot:XP_001122615.2 carbonic anhydrase 3 [Apis mellifera]